MVFDLWNTGRLDNQLASASYGLAAMVAVCGRCADCGGVCECGGSLVLAINEEET